VNGRNGSKGQQHLYYDDIYDAINKMVHGNPEGLSIKQIAMTLWPARADDTARNVLSRALNPNENDVNLKPEELDKAMDICKAPEHIIFYFCDKYGFERPQKKDPASFKREVKTQLKNVQDELRHIARKLENIQE